jgi:alcohol dehydrogenase (NADP+)
MNESTVFNPQTHALAVYEKDGDLKPFAFERRALREKDVAVRILYAGVCHTDIHNIKNEAGRPFEYPLVPGHEIMGEVIDVGRAVTRFTKGDPVLIGVEVDSCRVCERCREQLEVYCTAFTSTYGGRDRVDGTQTQGGFSTLYVADEHFVFKMPEGMDASRSAPLMCAGATVFSPLRYWQAGPGKTVGIVGVGGLGHLAVKYARALGAHVVAFTTSQSKIEEIKSLGAHEVVYLKNPAQVQAQAGKIDLMIDAVSSPHPMDALLWTVKFDGAYVDVGAGGRMDVDPLALMLGRRKLTSSASGGTAEIREMLEFSALHGIYPEIEFIKPDYVNTALERLERGDVRYRFVIDLTNGL